MVVYYRKGGRIRADDRDVSEFGANSPDLLVRWLPGPGTASPAAPWPLTAPGVRDALFRLLSDIGVRAIRFAPFGSRPRIYQAAFLENQAAFLGAFDDLVGAAERFGMAIVPSLFFSPYQIPPLFGENLASFAVPGTRSYDEFERLISIVVPRYRGSRAIGYWEFGNEQDIRLGIPSPGYAIDPAMGTPLRWTDADKTPNDYCHVVTERFQKLVRAHDSNPVGGAGGPRMIASGLQGWRIVTAQRHDWKKTVDERLYDDRTETLTLHPYEVHGWHARDYAGLMIYLRMLRDEMEKRGKPVIVGEFGVPTDYDGRGASALACFTDVLGQIDAAGMQLSLLWNIPANGGTDPLMDVHPRNARCRPFWDVFAKMAREKHT